MAKYYGHIGYSITEETESETHPGIWTDTIIEKPYFGDVLELSYNWRKSENLNDDYLVTNRLSIVADPYAYKHIGNMKYITWDGVKWKIKDITVGHPRLTITLGGLYNENTR